MEYISSALMMGGRVEFSVLIIETSYCLAILMAAVLNTVAVDKFFGTTGPYQYCPFKVMLNDLYWLALSFTISGKCM